jgi:hypothetical protein
MPERHHHVGGGPNPQTGNSIWVIDDPQLAASTVRIECAYSERDFANLVRTIFPRHQVVIKRGHPPRTIHLSVATENFDEAVTDFADLAIEPWSEAELAEEVWRARCRH